MKTTSTLLLAATLTASSLVTPQARADYQDMSNSYGMMATFHFNNAQLIAQQTTSQIMLSNNAAAQERLSTRRKSPRGVVRKTPQKARVTTTYRASPAVSKRVQTRLLALVAKTGNSPETVAQLKRDFQSDVIGAWAKSVAADGLRGGDVVDAMTANWVQNWQVANSVMTTKPTQVRAVRRQLTGILASNAAFAKLSNAQRQEMAEGFIYGQVLQSNVYLDAIKRGDKTLQKQISDGTATGFKKGMGLDLRRVRLSDAGFAAR